MKPSLFARRLLHNVQAVSQLWSALAFQVWLSVPLIQILVGVFPWRVNRWFGVTASIYYGLLTPLLFQVSAWHESNTIEGLQRSTCAYASPPATPQLGAAAICCVSTAGESLA